MMLECIGIAVETYFGNIESVLKRTNLGSITLFLSAGMPYARQMMEICIRSQMLQIVIQNTCFRVILDRSIKIILDIVTEGVPKIEISKKHPGFGCFVTRSISSLIFVKNIK